jgi:hypothetical protein
MAAAKKPAPRKPVAPRKPSAGVKTPMPKVVGSKPSPRKPMGKSGLTVVLPNGSTVGLRDLGKVKPTPKPKPKPKTTPKPTKMTPQDEAMKKIIKKRYGW